MSAIISSKEREALKVFKERISDLLVNFDGHNSHDLSLLRWLRARELDLNKAEDMLRQSVEWRIKENIDTIFEWKIPKTVEDNLLLLVPGFDKDGSLIAIISFGRWDLRNLISQGFKSDIIRFVDRLFIQAMEFLRLKSTNGKMVTQFNVVLDMEGFSLRQITSKETIECILDILRRFEANHPETLKEAWVVNAPKIFEILFALVKPLLSAHTMSKIRLYGSNEGQWRPALLNNKEPDQLPSQYGGSNISCNYYKMSHGFDVLPDYKKFEEDCFISETVGAGAKHIVKVELQKGSKLSWTFRTTDYNIGFSLVYSDSNENANTEVLFECLRADSHIHLQKGVIIVDKPGTYSLVFDNSFSRYRSKNLSYCTSVCST